MRARAAAGLAALAALGGCQSLGLRSGGTGEPPAAARPAVQCPRVATPADTADLVRFRTPDSRDLTDLVVAARITSLSGTCALVSRRTGLEVTIAVGMEATRGPAAGGRTIQLPYFVAVTTPEEEIVDRTVYVLNTEFPANVQRLRMRGEEIRLILPVSGESPASDLRVYVGFQLTEQELALNRSRVALR